jgi:hypothetical protein
MIAVGCRRREPIGYVPPVEHEQAYHNRRSAQAAMAGVTQKSLRNNRDGSLLRTESEQALNTFLYGL